MAKTSRTGTDAIQLLTDDHDTVRDLLKQLVETTDRAVKTRQDLVAKIAQELRAHAAIEEEIFYPALQENLEEKEDEKLVFEAYEEHRAAVELVLPDLENTEMDSAQFGGRAKVLKELVEHHADEEEDELFELARKVLTKEQLADLGQQMEQRKQELA